MRKEVIGTCPVCQNSLLATRLSCNVCHTEITGEFELSRFSYLNKEELNFIETFIRVYGNIKEMEKELDISYPTVKKMLEQVVSKMGFEARHDPISSFVTTVYVYFGILGPLAPVAACHNGMP